MPREAPEEPGLLALCYLSWCASPKTWSRLLCFLCAIVHSSSIALAAVLVLLRLPAVAYFPLLRVVLKGLGEDAKEDGGVLDTLIVCAFMVAHVVMAVPYVIVAAVGSKNTCLLLVAVVNASLELFLWIAVLIVAVINLSFVTYDWSIISQWIVIGSMLTLLLLCWSLLLATWKRRRHEQIIAMHTARLISQRKGRMHAAADFDAFY
jgi:hypothetical protein